MKRGDRNACAVAQRIDGGGSMCVDGRPDDVTEIDICEASTVYLGDNAIFFE